MGWVEQNNLEWNFIRSIRPYLVLQCKQFQFVLRLDTVSSFFRALSKYFFRAKIMKWCFGPQEKLAHTSILYSLSSCSSLSWKHHTKFLSGSCTRFLCCFRSTCFLLLIFTVRCTSVQSAVLRSYIVRPSARLSVCPSVTFRYRDHIGWNSWKIISRPNSLRSLLLLTPTLAIWCNGNTPKLGWNRAGVT